MRESLAEIFADPDGEDEDELQNDLQDKNERYSAKDQMKPFFFLDRKGKEQC